MLIFVGFVSTFGFLKPTTKDTEKVGNKRKKKPSSRMKNKPAKLGRCVSLVHFAKYTLEKYNYKKYTLEKYFLEKYSLEKYCLENTAEENE